jgi:hypothetical protein
MPYVSQAMADNQLVCGLKAKYAELLGQLEQCERRAEALRSEMAHVEATLRMFQGDWTPDTATGKRPYRPSRWSRRHQGTRLALTILREADKPLTTNEIALELLQRSGMPVDRDGIERTTALLRSALTKRIGQGVVCHEGYPKRWSIAAKESPGAEAGATVGH